MHRRPRRRPIVLGGIGLLAATALTLAILPTANGQTTGQTTGRPAGQSASPAAVTAGAQTPFTTVEAETGKLGGGAKALSLKPGDTPPTKATLETEASGNALVELHNNGDSVTLTNTLGTPANTLVVRASTPDSAKGGGIDSTLDLYVNGQYRQVFRVTSKQEWNYRGASTNLDDPNAGGMPYHFYNDFTLWVTGASIPAGAQFTLQKDAANTASTYDIDSVDLEKVGPAGTQPANSLSVVDYGADPGYTKDSTSAIQTAVNTARQQHKSVWIPPGKYMTNSLASSVLDFTGVTVQGAGMWYTTLYRKVPLPSPAGWRSQAVVGSGTSLSDVMIDGDAVYRGTGGGGDSGVQGQGAGGWHVNRIWTRHTDANWLSGTNGLMENSRTSDSYGDGFNINNANTPNPDKLGNNTTVRNCFARGSGDDGFATFSDAGAKGANGQIVGAKILNNTAVAPWWANGIRIAGGKNVEVENNLIVSVSSNNAMDISVFGDTGRPLESATVSGNVIIGGGGWNSVRYGVHIGSPSSTSFYPNAYTNVTMTNNVMRGSLRSEVYIDGTHVNATLNGNTIDGPAGNGIWIAKGVAGTGPFTGNTIKNLHSGQVAIRNDSPNTFKITG
jgi:hypothetical protein